MARPTLITNIRIHIRHLEKWHYSATDLLRFCTSATLSIEHASSAPGVFSLKNLLCPCFLLRVIPHTPKPSLRDRSLQIPDVQLLLFTNDKMLTSKQTIPSSNSTNPIFLNTTVYIAFSFLFSSFLLSLALLSLFMLSIKFPFFVLMGLIYTTRASHCLHEHFFFILTCFVCRGAERWEPRSPVCS